MPDLPVIVRDYLMATAAGSSGPGVRPWRDVLREQISATSSFLATVFGGGGHVDDWLSADSDSTLHRR